MLLKSKLLISLASVGVVVGIGTGISSYSKISHEKELEIDKKARAEAEESKKQKKITENKEILNNLLTECKKGIMKNETRWKSLYNPSFGDESEINFDCGSKKIKMKISKNQDSYYKKITDTTKRWWSEKEERFIVFEISEKTSHQ